MPAVPLFTHCSHSANGFCGSLKRSMLAPEIDALQQRAVLLCALLFLEPLKHFLANVRQRLEHLVKDQRQERVLQNSVDRPSGRGQEEREPHVSKRPMVICFLDRCAVAGIVHVHLYDLNDCSKRASGSIECRST
eukprot:scaffold22749_cov36-Phaeocystis_antarctica.AAC.2